MAPPAESSSSPTVAILQILVVGLFTGLVTLFIFFPLLVRFLPLIRRRQITHHRPISDIPGNPNNYDAALISAMCTLPDPNNFLSVYTFLPLARGIKFHQPRMPTCRYHSLSLYAGLYDPVQDQVPPSLCDDEIVYNDDGSFDVVICDEEQRPADVPNWMPRQGVTDGMLVIRRYGTRPGQRVDMPAFYALKSKAKGEGEGQVEELLKPAYSTYSGAHYAEHGPNHRFQRLLRVLLFLGCVRVLLVVNRKWTSAAADWVVLIAGTVLFSVYHLLYQIGDRRASKMCHSKTHGRMHVAIEPSLEYDKTSARPHPGHKYFVIAFDANEGDVVVEGLVFPSKQKFWSFVVYSEYGIPGFHCYTDETITYRTTTRGTFTSTTTSSNTQNGDGGEKAYRIVLTKNMEKHVPAENVIDVSGQPKGVVLVRLIFPESDAIFQQSKPKVELVPAGTVSASAEGKKEK